MTRCAPPVHFRSALATFYDVGEKHGFDWQTLETIVEYLEAKGFIASYEGTLYASLTLKGVERIESAQ